MLSLVHIRKRPEILQVCVLACSCACTVVTRGVHLHVHAQGSVNGRVDAPPAASSIHLSGNCVMYWLGLPERIGEGSRVRDVDAWKGDGSCILIIRSFRCLTSHHIVLGTTSSFFALALITRYCSFAVRLAALIVLSCKSGLCVWSGAGTVGWTRSGSWLSDERFDRKFEKTRMKERSNRIREVQEVRTFKFKSCV